MKIELQLRCGFSASWRVFPVLQRVLDRAHQDRVSADDILLLDSSVRADHHLHLYHARKPEPPGHFGVNRNRIGQHLAAFLRLQIPHTQAQRHRQRAAQDSSPSLVSHLHVPLELAFRNLLNASDLPCLGQAWN